MRAPDRTESLAEIVADRRRDGRGDQAEERVEDHVHLRDQDVSQNLAHFIEQFGGLHAEQSLLVCVSTTREASRAMRTCRGRTPGQSE